jgi:3-isopropylmalate dehydratase small subunit
MQHFPSYEPELIEKVELKNGDRVRIDLISGSIINLENQKTGFVNKFYDAQLSIYKNGGLL